MRGKVLFGREAETPEAKALWFRSLSLEERMDLFCEFTDLVLENNPRIREAKDAEAEKQGILVLRPLDN